MRGRQPGQEPVREKKERKFTIKMQKKLVVLYIFVLLAFAGLSVRLIWITRNKGVQYEKEALSQQKYDSTVLPYRRGDILDANGIKLATSEKVYNLVTDAKVMLSAKDKEGNFKCFEPTMQALEKYFDLDITAVREYIMANQTSAWKVWLKQLTYDQISGFQTEMEENPLIKGVWFEEEYKRKYPNGSLASDVIGFTGKDNTGTYGLEEYYNDTLNGTTGREYGYLNTDSELERTVKPAVDGYTIQSTIDVTVQGIVEKYLKQFNEQYQNSYREGNGAENVGCIIQDVNTGAILGMASYPDYDLNNPRDYSAMYGMNMVEEVVNSNGYTEIHKTDTIINESLVQNMTQEQLYLNLNALWKNFCISDTYEPGSVAKPFTVAAALETGAITGNEVYQCNGYLMKGGHRINCHVRYGEGAITVESAIARSCNVALMHIGEALGAERFGNFQQIFNFGLKTNIDLAGEARTAGLLFPADQMKESDLAVSTFGQGFNVTMIQMITGFSALINGGYYYEPHMVSKITDAGGATVKTIAPRVLKQVVSQTTSEKIRQYCKATVMAEYIPQRTGKKARPAGYSIGGKTGTAQTLPRGNKEYVVSFMGFAPSDDPQIAIYVVIDRLNDAKQDQASKAAEIVRNVLTEVLPYLQIFMTEELSDEEIKEMEERQLQITNQYGKLPEESENTTSPEENIPTGEETQPAWMNFPIDPETGYRKDPETGTLLDPETGEVIGEDYQAVPDTMNNP